MASQVRRLEPLEERMMSVDLAELDNDELKWVSRLAATGLRVVEGYITRVTAEAARREAEGTGSPVDDIGRASGASRNRAKRLAERAKLTDELPQLGSGVEEGSTNTENLDHLAGRTANLSESERKALAALDDEVSSAAANRTPEAFEKYVTKLLTRIKDPVEGGSIAERQHDASTFTMKRRFDGMWELFGKVDPERAAEVNDLINRRAKQLAGEGPVTGNTRAAVLYALVVNGGPDDGTRPSTRMGIGYIVDAKTLFDEPHDGSIAQTWAGDGTDPEHISWLACDAEWYGVAINNLGEPERVGRTRRKATRGQRLQLRAIYTGCPLDGTSFDRCDIHHVNVFWEDDGETDIDNLLPISTAWHHVNPSGSWSSAPPNSRSERSERLGHSNARSHHPRPSPESKPRLARAEGVAPQRPVEWWGSECSARCVRPRVWPVGQ